MRSSTFIALIVVLVIFGVGGFFYFRSNGISGGSSAQDASALGSAWQFGAEEGDGTAGGLFSGDDDSGAPGGSENVGGGAGPLTGENAQLYESVAYGFSFFYPPALTISEFNENGGDVILAEGPQGAGFQVFIIPWDEPMEVMTPERVHQDLPDLKILNPQTALLPWGKRVLIFESEDAALGRTREVWMVHGGQLYQITASLGQDAVLARVMETWRFWEE